MEKIWRPWMPRSLESLGERMLAHYMSELSEDRWCAGWLFGLEYALWNAMNGDDSGRSFVLTKQEKADLSELHQRTGGWVVWNEGEVFVSDQEWFELLEVSRQQRNA
jgi:hypothetical protein